MQAHYSQSGGKGSIYLFRIADDAFRCKECDKVLHWLHVRYVSIPDLQVNADFRAHFTHAVAQGFARAWTRPLRCSYRHGGAKSDKGKILHFRNLFVGKSVFVCECCCMSM